MPIDHLIDDPPLAPGVVVNLRIRIALMPQRAAERKPAPQPRSGVEKDVRNLGNRSRPPQIPRPSLSENDTDPTAHLDRDRLAQPIPDRISGSSPFFALPSPWETADIGAVGAAGSATQTDGEYTVNGSVVPEPSIALLGGLGLLGLLRRRRNWTFRPLVEPEKPREGRAGEENPPDFRICRSGGAALRV